MSSPEAQFVALTQKTGAIDNAVAVAIYDSLQPIAPEFMVGEWKGGDFEGHPGHEMLKQMKWAGKNFRSVDDVDPIIVYGDDGKRVWKEEWGHARVRQVKYRGKVSAAMIYDNHPIIDSFRYVNENLVAGAMETTAFKESEVGVYIFYLERIKADQKI